MVLIPINKNTTEYKIEYENKIPGTPRSYLGMSGLGNECLRAQWYGWRWTVRKSNSVRMRRLLDRGHLEEASIIGDLKKAGIEVFKRINGRKVEMTGEVGEEQEEIIGFHRHSMGHPDGRCTGVIEAPVREHLLEMKTMNNKYFERLKESLSKFREDSTGQTKALRNSFPEYLSQVTKYMGELKLERTLFVATNKNDQARKYIRIQFDKTLYKKLVEREEEIILSEKPPPKRYPAHHYICAWCNFQQVCHLGMAPQKTCRSCLHGVIAPEGRWHCKFHDKKISFSKQRRGCDNYKRLF